MKVKLIVSGLLFAMFSAVCVLEARLGAGGGVGRGGVGVGRAGVGVGRAGVGVGRAGVGVGAGRRVGVGRPGVGVGVGRRAGIYGGHGGVYAHGGRRWRGRGLGLGLAAGPLYVGSGIYGDYDYDDCYYDEYDRLVCFSPWA